MTNRWNLAWILVLAGAALVLPACQQTRKGGGSELSPRERETLLQPAPLPPDPYYAMIRQPCIFFVRTRDGSMAAVGNLAGNTPVVLLGQEPAWADIQTVQGVRGSVFAENVRSLTPAEASRLPIRYSGGAAGLDPFAPGQEFTGPDPDLAP